MPTITDLRGPAGRLEALLDTPDPAPVRAAAVFAHPHPEHGGTMHTKVVYQGAKALTRIGCAVLRFNFRGVGASEGAFDRGEGEQADFRAGLDLIGIAPPVVTSVSGQNYTFENTLESLKPKFFVQGEADEVCPLEGLWQFYGRLDEPKEIVVIDGADHLFEGKTQEVGEALEDLLFDFNGDQT
jgi:uncharacterized protein